MQNKGAPIPPVKSFQKPSKKFKEESLISSLLASEEKVTPAVNVKAKLDIKDMTWEDKEKILRLLFAKMNGTSITKAADRMENARHKPDKFRSHAGFAANELHQNTSMDELNHEQEVIQESNVIDSTKSVTLLQESGESNISGHSLSIIPSILPETTLESMPIINVDAT